MYAVRLFLLCVFVAASFLSAADFIASWDFSGGKADSLDGKYEFALQNNSYFDDLGLHIQPSGDKPHGLRSKRVYAELSPQGSFELAISFTLDESAFGEAAPKQIYLWDSKYVPSPNPKQARYHYGFCLYLIQSKGKFSPRSAFGYGEHSQAANAGYQSLEANSEYTLVLRYDQYGKVSYILNGKALPSILIPAGQIAPAKLATQIGDRYGSSQAPLPGHISKVSLAAIQTDEPGSTRVQKTEFSLSSPPVLEPAQNCLLAWDFKAGNLVSKPGDCMLSLRDNSAVVAAGEGYALWIKDNEPSLPSGAVAAGDNPLLAPEGSFSVNVSFYAPSEHFSSDKYATYYLLDNKYIALPNEKQKDYHKGFSLILCGTNEKLRPRVYLGFGESSESVMGKSMTVSLERWHLLKMRFDVKGEVKFWLDGVEAGGGTCSASALAAAKRLFSIGSRLGSSYYPFPGFIGSVQICQED